MALKIDAASFGERLAKLQAGLRLNDADGSAKWGGATALAVVTGPSVDEIRYVKSIALQLWLFGCAFDILYATCCYFPDAVITCGMRFLANLLLD